MTWTIHELDQRFLAYSAEVRQRDQALIRFCVIVLLMGLLLVVARFYGFRAYVLPGLAAWLVVMACLGGYVLVTSNRFHRKAEVRCPDCGASLTQLCMALDPEEREDPLPTELRCPACGTLVAAVSNRGQS